MDKLLLSKRMFIDNEFVNGGILVTPDGTIRSVMRSQQEVNSWMYANEADEVGQNNFFLHSCINAVSILSLFYKSNACMYVQCS